MSVTDPIADMATLIRNASKAGKENVDVKASKIKEEIIKILKREKFIKDYKSMPDIYGDASSQRRTSKDEKKCPHKLRVYLKFDKDKKPSIENIKRVSKPGLRVYKGKDKIPLVLGGLGVAILSTSVGLLTDKEAREKNLGGEVLLEVW